MSLCAIVLLGLAPGVVLPLKAIPPVPELYIVLLVNVLLPPDLPAKMPAELLPLQPTSWMTLFVTVLLVAVWVSFLIVMPLPPV